VNLAMLSPSPLDFIYYRDESELNTALDQYIWLLDGNPAPSLPNWQEAATPPGLAVKAFIID
jgi:hypothetical protein